MKTIVPNTKYVKVRNGYTSRFLNAPLDQWCRVGWDCRDDRPFIIECCSVIASDGLTPDQRMAQDGVDVEGSTVDFGDVVMFEDRHGMVREVAITHCNCRISAGDPRTGLIHF